MKVVYNEITKTFSKKPDSWSPPSPVIRNGKIVNEINVRVVHTGSEKDCDDYIKTYKRVIKGY